MTEAGDPNTPPFYKEAVEALYTASYSLTFLCKDILKRDYVVPPLEGLWWAKDMADFILAQEGSVAMDLDLSSCPALSSGRW